MPFSIRGVFISWAWVTSMETIIVARITNQGRMMTMAEISTFVSEDIPDMVDTAIGNEA